MTMGQVVVDTDILSAIMKSDPVVIPRARHYLGDHGRFTFSVITRYEILRGLKAKDAENKPWLLIVFVK
jgi:tRNA(fMet)-specific endonuclease VapC